MKNETKDKIKIDCFDEMRQIAYSRESDEVKEKKISQTFEKANRILDLDEKR